MSKITSEEKEINKKRILEVGKRMFLEQGFDNVNMRAIAKEAGVGASTIYGYYDTKMSLFFEAIISELDKTVDFHTDLEQGLNQEIRLDTVAELLSDLMITQFKKILTIGKLNLRKFYNVTVTSGNTENMFLKINTLRPTQTIAVKTLKKAQEQGNIITEFDFYKASEYTFNVMIQSAVSFLYDDSMDLDSLQENIKDQLKMFFIGKIKR